MFLIICFPLLRHTLLWWPILFTQSHCIVDQTEQKYVWFPHVLDKLFVNILKRMGWIMGTCVTTHNRILKGPQCLFVSFLHSIFHLWALNVTWASLEMVSLHNFAKMEIMGNLGYIQSKFAARNKFGYQNSHFQILNRWLFKKDFKLNFNEQLQL